MRTASCLLLLVSLLACNKHEEPAAASAADTPPDVQASAAAQPEPAAETQGGLKLDASKAKAYVTYQEKMIEFHRYFGKAKAEFDKKGKDNQYEGTVGHLRGWKDVADVGGELKKKEAEARKEAGLSEAEVAALGEINEKVVPNVLAGKQVADQIAAREKALAAMPPAQQAQARQQLEEMKKELGDQLGLKEERAEYGDAIVDAMLAEGETLVRLLKEQAKAVESK